MRQHIVCMCIWYTCCREVGLSTTSLQKIHHIHIHTICCRITKTFNKIINFLTYNLVKEIKQYQKKWLQHVQRMGTNRIPKQALQYRPKERRNIGRPKKRWKDQLHFEGQGTGNTPKPSRT